MACKATTLHGILDEAAMQYPEQICLRMGDDAGLTYEEVRKASARCAAHVSALGEKPGVVLICADRCYGMLVAMLGTMRAGWAYCPVEPDFPRARVAAIIETAALTFCLSPVRQAPQPIIASFPQLTTLAIQDDGRMERMGEALPSAPELVPEAVSDDTTAYIIFTSGSTGRPKGCMVPHRGSALYAHAVVEACGLDQSMNFLLKTPYVFDVSIQDIYTAFSAAGTLVIAEPGVHKHASELAALVKKQCINCMAFTPTMLVEFVNHLARDASEAAEITRNLSRVLTIGEALMSATCKELFELIPSLDGKIHNLYGPTEASVGVSHFQVSTASLGESVIAPIGKPLSYVHFRVFDPSVYEDKDVDPELLVEVQPGELGELFIGGDCLAKGYMNNPEKTSESFFDYPQVLARPKFAASCYSLYKTGDLVRRREDGVFEISGRTDFQVKIGGVRIECEEISAVLKAHTDIEDALVTVFQGPFGKALVAYVVSTQDLAIKPCNALLKRWVQETSLLAAMRPMLYIPLITFPKNAAGKVDRSALPDAQAAFEQLGSEAKVANLAKPDKSLFGLRFLLIMMVVCQHAMEPNLVGTQTSFNFTVPGFFVLAGFLLSSSITKAPSSLLGFYRNRIITAHPLYLLAVLFYMPLIFLKCPPGKSAIWPESQKTICLGGMSPASTVSEWWYHFTKNLIMVVFAQMAWPWGSESGFDQHLWFISAYYFCIICFPLLRWLLHSHFLGHTVGGIRCCSRSGAFLLSLWILVCCSIPALNIVCGMLWEGLTSSITNPDLKEFLNPTAQLYGRQMTFEHNFPLGWALTFFLGMILHSIFEANAAGPKWSHWGKVTDLTSLFLGLTFVLGFVLGKLDPTTFEHDGWREKVAWFWGGDWPYRAVTSFVCFWIYGLAKGEGLTVKLLRTKFLVTYLSPAAYSMYLFHQPILEYISILKSFAGLPTTYTVYWYEFSVPWWIKVLDFLAVMLVTVAVALLASHVINAPLTAGFLKCWDCIFACCKRRAEDPKDDLDTLQKVRAAIEGVSGAEVDGSTVLAECGLDSFGTGALLGILRPKFPGLRITALEIYQLRTVADLVQRIDCSSNQTAAPPICDEV